MFTLRQKSPTKFQVVNSVNGDLVGSISVDNEREAAELMRQFGGATQPQASKPTSMVSAMVRAFRAKQMSPTQRAQFVLRGT